MIWITRCSVGPNIVNLTALYQKGVNRWLGRKTSLAYHAAHGSLDLLEVKAPQAFHVETDRIHYRSTSMSTGLVRTWTSLQRTVDIGIGTTQTIIAVRRLTLL